MGLEYGRTKPRITDLSFKEYPRHILSCFGNIHKMKDTDLKKITLKSKVHDKRPRPQSSLKGLDQDHAQRCQRKATIPTSFCQLVLLTL